MRLSDILKERVLFIDGAMGTNIISRVPSISGGNAVTQPLELLNVTSPRLISDIHEAFIKVGCDVVETNTFGANRLALKEAGLEVRAAELAKAGVAIAKTIISSLNKFTPSPSPLPRGERVIFVSASIGPTGRLPSLGQVTLDEMESAYIEQISACIEAGADLIQIETCQDPLQAKTALIATKTVSQALKKDIPIIVTATVEPNGKTLLGTDIEAFLTTVEPYAPLAVGLNCSTGPAEMEEWVKNLCDISPFPVAVLPNAGLPELTPDGPRYNLSPEDFAKWLEYFVRDLGVSIVGGCCGTTPKHLEAVIKQLGGIKPKKRKVLWRPRAASLFSASLLDQEPRPLLIGERTNTTGSREFREALKASNYDAALAVARNQAKGGVHLLDLSVAYAGRDEVADMREMASRIVRQIDLPLIIDSNNPEVLGHALKLIGGRPVINSINLEDGGKKAEAITSLAVRFGTALVALTIDEEGMAMTRVKKTAIADRVIKLMTERGLRETDIFIDPLTFTLADPKTAEMGAGLETLGALKEIKKRHPGIKTILGVSNISYGLPSKARQVINSVFLYEALQSGLDAAILNAAQIVPLDRLPKEMVKTARDILHNRPGNPMKKLLDLVGLGGPSFGVDSRVLGKRDPKEALRLALINGDTAGLSNLVDQVIKGHKATDIINKILLPAMKEVGELFGEGRLPLPFVLQSAEVMKGAVDLLKPHLGAGGGLSRGRLVLATVRGDVHDIGKNLVEIILSNNGFEVVNLGVKQPAENIIGAALGEKADAIGLSGLLVSSTLVMKEDLEEMNRRGISLPVICGGAALTRRFVEETLSNAYKGRVYYAKDAFEGLKIMEQICSGDTTLNCRS